MSFDRIGADAAVNIAPNLKLSGEVAYTRGFLDETDWHNLRPGIRPLPQDALNGNGVQAEAILSFAVTPAFNVGIGGRYWYIRGDGFTRFDQTAGGGSPQHTKFWPERYGGFAQASYRFGDPASMPVVAPVRYTKAPPMVYAYSWTGLHFGVNAGYGFSDSDTTFAPLSFNANAAINIFGDTPTNQHTQNAGFPGGGQISYDWQFGRSWRVLRPTSIGPISAARSGRRRRQMHSPPRPITTSVRSGRSVPGSASWRRILCSSMRPAD